MALTSAVYSGNDILYIFLFVLFCLMTLLFRLLSKIVYVYGMKRNQNSFDVLTKWQIIVILFCFCLTPISVDLLIGFVFIWFVFETLLTLFFRINVFWMKINCLNIWTNKRIIHLFSFCQSFKCFESLCHSFNWKHFMQKLKSNVIYHWMTSNEKINLFWNVFQFSSNFNNI